MRGLPRDVAMNIVVEFFVVTFKVLWAFVLAAARWLVRPKEKSVAGQVCLITGAGSGLGRLFALEFARRRALLVLWDINTQSNEETAGMVRHIYRDLEAADAAALQGNSDRRPRHCWVKPLPSPAPSPRGRRNPTVTAGPALEEEHPTPRSPGFREWNLPPDQGHGPFCIRREKVCQSPVLTEVQSLWGRLWAKSLSRARELGTPGLNPKEMSQSRLGRRN